MPKPNIDDYLKAFIAVVKERKAMEGKNPMKSLKTATGDSVLRAYSKAVKNLQADSKMIGSEVSAGFIIPDGGRAGYQVSVKVCRFCKELLKKHPDTGGLIHFWDQHRRRSLVVEKDYFLALKKASSAKIHKESASSIKKMFRKPTKKYLTKLFPMKGCRGPIASFSEIVKP